VTDGGSHRVYWLLLSPKQLTPSVSPRQLPQRGELFVITKAPSLREREPKADEGVSCRYVLYHEVLPILAANTLSLFETAPSKRRAFKDGDSHILYVSLLRDGWR
jgi:hypothetical protein